MNTDSLQWIITAVDRASPVFRVVEASLGRLERVAGSVLRAFGTMARGAADLARTLLSSLISALERLTAMATRAATVLGGGLLAAMVAVGKAGVDMNVTIQGATAALTRLAGGAEAAQKLIAGLKEEAKISILGFKELLPLSQQLVAAYGPAGIGKVLPTLRAFGDAATLLGVSANSQQMALLGFRQLITARQPNQEDLNQVSENLPGLNVRQILRRQFGSSDLDTLRAAKVTGAQVADAIVAGMQEQFGGAQQAAQGTLPMILARFGDAWNELTAAVTARFTPALTAALGKLLEAFEKLSGNERVIRALAVPFDLLAALLTKLADQLPAFTKWLEEILTAENVVNILSQIAGFLKTIWDNVVGFVQAATGGGGFAALWEAFQNAAKTALDFVVRAWNGFVAGVEYLVQNSPAFFKVVEDGIHGVRGAVDLLVGSFITLQGVMVGGAVLSGIAPIAGGALARYGAGRAATAAVSGGTVASGALSVAGGAGAAQAAKLLGKGQAGAAGWNAARAVAADPAADAALLKVLNGGAAGAGATQAGAKAAASGGGWLARVLGGGAKFVGKGLNWGLAGTVAKLFLDQNSDHWLTGNWGLAGALAATVEGAGTGAMIGGIGGSVVPGLGTATGAGIGGVFGGGIGLYRWFRGKSVADRARQAVGAAQFVGEKTIDLAGQGVNALIGQIPPQTMALLGGFRNAMVGGFQSGGLPALMQQQGGNVEMVRALLNGALAPATPKDSNEIPRIIMGQYRPRPQQETPEPPTQKEIAQIRAAQDSYWKAIVAQAGAVSAFLGSGEETAAARAWIDVQAQVPALEAKQQALVARMRELVKAAQTDAEANKEYQDSLAEYYQAEEQKLNLREKATEASKRQAKRERSLLGKQMDLAVAVVENNPLLSSKGRGEALAQVLAKKFQFLSTAQPGETPEESIDRQIEAQGVRGDIFKALGLGMKSVGLLGGGSLDVGNRRRMMEVGGYLDRIAGDAAKVQVQVVAPPPTDAMWNQVMSTPGFAQALQQFLGEWSYRQSQLAQPGPSY